MHDTMLREAIERSGIPPKALAAETNYSVDAIYAACAGKRKIPREARQKLSGMHLLAGLAVALEATGYKKVFGFFAGDRHPQNLIRRVEKEDTEADEALKPLGWLLIDKAGPEDLTDEDRQAVKTAAREIMQRIQAEFNLLIELEDRFKLGLTQYLTQGKEKTA